MGNINSSKRRQRMYKPRLDISTINKGFAIVHNCKNNYLCCNLSKYNQKILDEIKEHEINKFSIEESCEISDFDFLLNFKRLQEIVISFSHEILDIASFNKLKELKVLGLPQFMGTFSNKSVEYLGFVWNEQEDFADNLENLKTISIQKCYDFQAFIEKIKKIESLKKIVFKDTVFPLYSCKNIMKNVEEVELQYCNMSSLEAIINAFPNCKSLLLSNVKNNSHYEEIKKLKKLERLSIFSSSSIKDLSFISELFKLNTLKIVSTKIEPNSSVSILSNIPHFSFYMTGIDRLLSKK